MVPGSGSQTPTPGSPPFLSTQQIVNRHDALGQLPRRHRLAATVNCDLAIDAVLRHRVARHRDACEINDPAARCGIAGTAIVEATKALRARTELTSSGMK